MWQSYYKSDFPAKEVLQFYGNAECRIWAAGDHFRRFSASHSQEFIAALGNESSYHVGALLDTPFSEYTVERVHKTSKNYKERPQRIVHKELVFDLDADQFVVQRAACGCGANKEKMCNQCWSVVVDAAKTIDAALRVIYGVTKLQWCFTGGRGLHCWVLDDRFSILTVDKRKDMVHTLTHLNPESGPGRLIAYILCNVSLHGPLVLDASVTTSDCHLTRGIFSPRENGAICIPISLGTLSRDINDIRQNVCPNVNLLKTHASHRLALQKSIHLITCNDK